VSILIKDTTIITQNQQRKVLLGDIYIEEDTIQEIASHISVEADYTLSGRHKMALPGLVNTHTHVPMTLMRGYGDDMALEEWLSERIWPIEAKLTPPLLKAGAHLAFVEMISTGTTCCADMYFFEDILSQAAHKTGLRGYMGFSLIDFDTPEMAQDHLFPECEKFVKKWRHDTLIQPVIAPHSTYSCSPETLQKAGEMAKKHQVLLHTHCSETRKEVYDVKKRYDARPIAHLKKQGLLHENMLLAHCGWITKGEVTEIAQAGATVSHNPISNMKLATGGFTPLPELLENHVTVGLGTDGAASNNSLDMFEVMKFTALLHKHHRWDPRILPAPCVLDLATRDGASCLGLDAGSLEVGKKADIILMDLNRPNLVPQHDLISLLVYSAKGSDVSTTIVNGQPVMLERKLMTLDYPTVLEEAERAARELVADSSGK
jgi:5-methylthioadenosine/S-adenosylhomocysteine deaminase